MDEKILTPELVKQFVQFLQMFQLNPQTDIAYKTIDSDLYSTSTITVTDADGNTVTLLRKTMLEGNPLAIKSEIDSTEAKLQEQLTDVQEKKQAVQVEIDKLPQPASAIDDATDPTPSPVTTIALP